MVPTKLKSGGRVPSVPHRSTPVQRMRGETPCQYFAVSLLFARLFWIADLLYSYWIRKHSPTFCLHFEWMNACKSFLTTNALPSITISCDAHENVAKTIRICVRSELRNMFIIIRNTTWTTANAYEHLRMSDDHFAIIANCWRIAFVSPFAIHSPLCETMLQYTICAICGFCLPLLAEVCQMCYLYYCTAVTASYFENRLNGFALHYSLDMKQHWQHR